VGGDIQWLACALSWLDADVVAVQEVKQSASADLALATLLSELNRLVGRTLTWRASTIAGDAYHSTSG
jgi:predicted extracellular nuclease